MSATHSITVDSDKSIVRITLTGFFEPGSMAAFLADRATAHAQLTCAANAHCTITDTRAMKIQSADMVEAFRDLLADPFYRSRKLAFVVAPTLARAQLMRAISDRGARTFATHAEAEAWVAAAEGEAVAA